MDTRKIACVLIAALACMVPANPARAIEEEVGALAPEIFQAAVTTLMPYGIGKQDAKKFTVESKWVEDTVERNQKHYIFKTKKNFTRQYKIKISLNAWPRYSVVKVAAEVRYRPADSGRNAPWRKLKTGRDDYELERMFFNKILLHIEAARTGKNPAS